MWIDETPVWNPPGYRDRLEKMAREPLCIDHLEKIAW